MNSLDDIFDAQIAFRSRPNPSKARFRLTWRIPILLLMLEVGSKKGRSSIARLHVVNSILICSSSADELLDRLSMGVPDMIFPLRVEPSLIRTIELCAGYRLMSLQNGNRVILEPAGQSFAQKKVMSQDLFLRERGVLARTQRLITEALASSIVKGKA